MSRKPAPEPGYEPSHAPEPHFDRVAIHEHLTLLHDLAAGCGGNFVLVPIEDGEKPKPQRFAIGDIDRMVETIVGFENYPGLNLYVSWATMRSDLETRKKGGEADVISVLAAVGDLDNDKYEIGELPVEPPYIIETSAGNYQAFCPFRRPLSVSEAKPALTALCDFIGGDRATADCSHIWRIPGTLNWPTKSKIARGRSPIPQLVTIKKDYDGRLIEPEELLALARPAKPKNNGHDKTTQRLGPGEETRLRNALSFIPADEYDIWVTVGMACHGIDARAIWDAWSRTSVKFDPEVQERKWNSFKKPVTLGTIYKRAGEHGWKPPVEDIPPNLGNGDATSEPFFDNRASGSPLRDRHTPWPTPSPIPDGLLPVAAFEPDLLPASIEPHAVDIADRMQCPLDFVGIAALAALGAVLGRKVGVRPKQRSDWTVVANLWGMVVGSPGSMKSPAIEEILKPLRRLAAKAANAYVHAMSHYENELTLFEISRVNAKKKARKANADSLRETYEKSISPSILMDCRTPCISPRQTSPTVTVHLR